VLLATPHEIESSLLTLSLRLPCKSSTRRQHLFTQSTFATFELTASIPGGDIDSIPCIMLLNGEARRVFGLLLNGMVAARNRGTIGDYLWVGNGAADGAF
jgi:hypothetical protein